MAGVSRKCDAVLFFTFLVAFVDVNYIFLTKYLFIENQYGQKAERLILSEPDMISLSPYIIDSKWH